MVEEFKGIVPEFHDRWIRNVVHSHWDIPQHSDCDLIMLRTFLVSHCDFGSWSHSWDWLEHWAHVWKCFELFGDIKDRLAYPTTELSSNAAYIL